MPKERESTSKGDAGREPFVTVDDLLDQAETLTAGLRTLSEYKHPLDIRRGIRQGKGVEAMAADSDSITIKAGARTYFFDLKETKQEKPFLVITESRFKGEEEERERSSITVFPENAAEFAEAVSAMASKIE
jgi:hypothetical protein